MRIQEQYMHPLFFVENHVIVERRDPFPLMMKSIPFYYDQTEEEKPWEDYEHTLPFLFSLWYEERERLVPLFAARNRTEAKTFMIRSVQYFLAALFWLNGQKVDDVRQWEKRVNELAYKPLNVVDRLSFIIDRIDVYHSFIQLDELFEELIKLFHKMLAMKKRG